MVAFFNTNKPFVHQANQFFIWRKISRKNIQSSGQSKEFFLWNPGFQRVMGIVAVKIFPVFIKPGLRKNADTGSNSLQGIFQFAVYILFQNIHILFSGKALFYQFLGINRVQRGTPSNPFIHLGLGKIGFITLVVAILAKADDIDDHVLVKGLPIINGQPDHVNNSFRIFAVNMKDRDHQHLGNVRRITGGASVFRKSGIANLIVDHQMDGAAGFISGEL